ncbi:MAG: hypothetical protein ACOH1M_07200 [Rhodoglobus sp.]
MNRSVEKLTQLVTDLPGEIDAALAIEVNTGNVNATGNVAAVNVNATGSGTFPAGLNSVGVFNLDVSTLPGTRRTDWVNISGAIGYAPSSITKKTNVANYTGKASAFLACQPVVFEYIGQVAIRDDPENPHYDPNYIVPTELGFIAEWLVELGLSEFVFYEEDGVTPAGIHYAEFAAVAAVVIGRDLDARLRAAGL